MKYLYVDQFAATELISERTLQSAEFGRGALFVDFLRSKVMKIFFNHKIMGFRQGEGCFIVSREGQKSNFIVFDYEEAPLLLSRDDNGVLLVLQKTLRFSIKIWENLKPSSHEKILSNNKAVVFPYPIGMQTELRAVIDRNPDEKRRSKREDGSALLVYKFADAEGDGVAEVARLTNFRKASEGRDAAYQTANEELSAFQHASQPGSKALAVTELEHAGLRSPAQQTGLSGWLPYLTSKQRDFVERTLDVPHRIEGPAGTGKTLCLVLKCLNTLESAANEKREHRALFIAHSEATKRSIENLFAMNDSVAFTADDIS